MFECEAARIVCAVCIPELFAHAQLCKEPAFQVAIGTMPLWPTDDDC